MAWAACTCICRGGGSGCKNEFLRGYHTEFGGGRECPAWVTSTYLCDRVRRIWRRIEEEMSQEQYGTYIGFAGRGEMIPNENCYCEIDPEVVDQWGIPVLRFHWQVE